MQHAPAELFDIGVNLTNKSFRKNREQVLQAAWDAGLVGMLLTGTSVAASAASLELCALDPARLFTTAGVHPHEADSYDAEAGSALRELAQTPAVKAIGECGLDFNRDFSPRPDQERAFAAQLELACELQLPVFLHQRDAHARFAAILRDHRDRLPGAVVHCFTGSREELHESLDLDCHIGITGWICDERRGQELQQIVADIPAERLLLETDAPFLLPRTLRPKPKDGRNQPAFLPEVLRTVAQCRGDDPAALARQTTANARRLFRLPGATAP